jgi:hypothetical protein
VHGNRHVMVGRRRDQAQTLDVLAIRQVDVRVPEVQLDAEPQMWALRTAQARPRPAGRLARMPPQPG